MKDKKNSIDPNTPHSQAQLTGKLKRRQEKLKKEAEKKEKKRNALFRRRVREASEKKAPKTLRTKAYYRFSKDYPNDVTPEGFRKNDPQKETLSATKKFAVFTLCLAAFLIGFIGVQTAIELSNREIPSDDLSTSDTASQGIKSMHITPDEFAAYTAEELEVIIRDNGCNSALFEFKSEYGFVYFESDSTIGGASNPVYGAYDKISYLSEKDITCIAYISCFKDTVAATASSGMEVLTKESQTFFDAHGNAWLDPFSTEAKTYILSFVRQASEGGFPLIMLDNICFPTEYTAEGPVYKADASSAEAKNTVLIDFINQATNIAGKEKLITMCDTYGFYENEDIPNEKYGKSLLSAESMMFATDLRLSRQEPAVTGNTQLFRYVEDMPMVFILDAGSLAEAQLMNAKETSSIFAVVEKEPFEAYSYAVHSGIENVVIW